MIKEKLIEKFGSQINHMSCVYLDDGENVLRSYLKDIGKIRTAIEIGTYQGVSACIISEFADKVHSIDIEPRQLTQHIINFLEVENVITYVVENREKEIDIVNDIFEKENVDFVFIDGEHFNGELEKDFEMTKKCKKILIHDYAITFHEVYNFCNQKEKEGYKKDIRGTFCLLTKQDKRGRKKNVN